MAAPVAYGIFQARGQIRAAAGAYATAMATLDPSHIFDLQSSFLQGQILNPLREAGDQTCILRDTMMGP